MLEANVYDNFNPNYYNISDFRMPNGKKRKKEAFQYQRQDVKLLITNCGKQAIFTLHQLH